MSGPAAPQGGASVVPCDFCKAPISPFGFAPPPHLGIKVRRPIKTCAAQACKDQARARVQALVDGHNPFGRGTGARSPDPAPKGGPKQSQGSLF